MSRKSDQSSVAFHIVAFVVLGCLLVALDEWSHTALNVVVVVFFVGWAALYVIGRIKVDE